VNRALRAATMGVLLLSPVALSACSAGQVTQTATQERDKTGAMAQAGDITVRQAQLAYPNGGSYERGDDAELLVAIVNSGEEPDTLVGISGDGFSGVEFSGSAGSSAASSPSSPASSSAAAPSSSSPTGSATGTNSGSNEGIEIPPDSTVFVNGEDVSVTLTGLDQSLTTGQYIEVTLTFEKAGDVTIPVTVANPSRSLDRGETFNFNDEQHANQSNKEDTEVAGGGTSSGGGSGSGG
jgi:copper(I)-binding protein